MSDFNIEDYRVTAPVLKTSHKQRYRKRKLFVPGPIPVGVIGKFRLPVAFKVWLALHTRRHMGYEPRLAARFMAAFGLNKRDAQRGLAQLERDGLARVRDRGRGRAFVVELLDVHDEDAEISRKFE